MPTGPQRGGAPRRSRVVELRWRHSNDSACQHDGAGSRTGDFVLLDLWGRLIDIPAKCDQAGQQLTEASAEEQQAEISHTQNVNNALTAAAVVFMGTALVAGEVGAAAATRPPVIQQNNYYESP